MKRLLFSCTLILCAAILMAGQNFKTPNRKHYEKDASKEAFYFVIKNEAFQIVHGDTSLLFSLPPEIENISSSEISDLKKGKEVRRPEQNIATIRFMEYSQERVFFLKNGLIRSRIENMYDEMPDKEKIMMEGVLIVYLATIIFIIIVVLRQKKLSGSF